MRKLVLISFIALVSFVVYSCDKNEPVKETKNLNSEMSNQRTGLYIPGEIFSEDGWIGWIDPDLWDEPLPEVNKEDPRFAGWKEEHEGETRIICPKPGENCGRLYIIDPEIGIVYVGVYLED